MENKNNITKGGKKSISTKPKESGFSYNYGDLFGNALQLSSKLEKELKDQGLAWRFIDAKKLSDMGGYIRS
jgi:hypothetical protein